MCWEKSLAKEKGETIPRDQSEQGLKDAETLSRYEYKVIGPVYQADNLDGLETSSDTNSRRRRHIKDERSEVIQGNDATSGTNW